MPKEMVGTSKQQGRTCGGVRGRRNGGQTGPVPLRGGWERGGVPMPGGTLRGSDEQGGARLAFSLANSAPRSLLGSQARSSALWSLLWPRGS